MPKREQFTIWNRQVVGINLSHGVGPGRSNLAGDVMLVQALLNFIADGNHDASVVGLASLSQLPDVHGHWDSPLDKAIVAFQSKYKRLLRQEPIGQVSPVGAKFDVQDGDEWPTILFLNQLAEDATGLIRNELLEGSNGEDSGHPYPGSLCSIFPQLVRHLTP